MKPLPRILPLLLILYASLVEPHHLATAASGGRITGKIMAQDGSGLLGAVITIFKQDSSGGTISFTRSDRTGAYTLSSLAPGAYYLQVSREGYQPLTRSNVKILSGKTANLDVVLEELLDLIVADPDPRNWDIRTLMRGTSDRRLVFRYLQASGDRSTAGKTVFPEIPNGTRTFTRSGTVNLTSSAGLSSENYSVFPSIGHNGFVSNFAYVEPVSDKARMIFSGQLNSGYDSLWRVRNTYNYRPESGRDVNISVGYGRLSLNAPTMGSVGPAQFFSQDPSLRESGVQTLSFGFETRSRLADPIEVEYGFDYSRVHYGSTKSVISPMFRLILTPAETWTVKAGISSRRLSDNNMVLLPDGDWVNLMEPTYLAQIDGELHLSQFKHAEIAAGKSLAQDTSLELAVYEDQMEGPGAPFLVTVAGGRSSGDSKLALLREDQATQRGLRIVMNRRFLDFLSGSIAYVYGSAANLDRGDETLTSDILARRLLEYVERSYYHVLTSQVDANFPKTRTRISTVVRWHPGYTLNPIDPFSDRKDTVTKGVSFFVRQGIPLPEFMGTVGRWEALVDVRNLLDQGKSRIISQDGELTLTRNPRSIRFGLNLNFY